MKYLIISRDDADLLLSELSNCTGHRAAALMGRLYHDTGGDIEEIVTDLKKLETCFACHLEGQHDNCNVLDAQRHGRRLGRLLARAYPEYRAPLGTPVEQAAELVVAHVEKTGVPVLLCHNDHRIPVRVGTSVKDILSQWTNRSESASPAER